MKQKRLLNIVSQRGLLPLMAVFLCLIGSTGQVWATTYYAKLTANGEAGKGYVYASSTNNDAAATELASATTKTSTQTSSTSQTQNHYAWAFPARAYKFSGWTGSTSPKATVKANTGKSDNIQITGGTTSNGTVGTATASWTALTPYTITYLAPENGSYSVQYSYVDNKSGNAGLQAYNPSYNMTSAGGNQAVTSYERDEITLSVVGGTFLGWYEATAEGDDVTLLSTDEDFVYANNTTGKKVTKSLYIKAKFKEPSLYQASVTISGVTTNYKTWAEALAAANASSANPTITLLDNVLDLTASQSITKSMTLDLNDYSITGNVSKLININAAGITVIIRDNGEKGKGTISMIGSGNANLYGICITKGTLNLESGTIHTENTAAYASNNSERASGVYVASPYTFNMTGGKIEAVADYYAYGVNIASGSATAHGTANISGGVVEATANIYARGVTTTGDLNITGGEIIANTISSSTAYGVYMDGDNAAKTIVEGGTITATAFTTTAYGILLNKASNILNVTGGTILAKTAGTTKAYGIFHNAAATTNVSGGAITGNPKTTTGYGIYSKGGTVNVTGGTIFGNATTETGVGIYAEAGTVNVEGGVVKSAAPTKTSYALQQASSAVFNVTGGKFYTTSAATLACATAATAANMKISGGFYNLSTNIASYIPSDFEIFTLTDGAEYNEGYRFVPAAERPMGVSVCKIIDGSNTIFFYSMENALTYANQNSTKTLKLIVLSNCSLSAGYYTIPSNTTLVVPWNATQTNAIGTTPTRRGNEFITPSLYCRLTLEEGVNLDVFGTIEASCQMAIKGQIGGSNGCPSGPYGHILMEENTHITLESGSKLIAWGYVTGKGTIDAKRGSYVYEGFQMKDFPGGTCASGMISSKKAFPVTQYYIQNVEVATTYRPGSRLYCATGAYIASGTRSADNVAIISNSASLFLMDDEDMSEDTWVRKSYDATKDVQVYEINSSASIGNLNINISGYQMQSSSYDLPITNNMLIKVLTGTMGITQNTIVFPGAEIEVMKEATVRINSGCSLYLIDQAEWANKHGVANGVFAHKIDYTPSWTTCPRNTGVNPPSAKVNLHGTFDMSGVVYTSAGGANICSTNEDAGTIKLNTAAPTSTKTTYTKYSTDPKYEEYVCNPAQIRNTDGTFASIAGAKSGSSYCFIDDQWRCLETKVPFVIDKTDQYNWVYYAKPADYVALQGGSTTADPTPDDKHLYHAADGERLLILMPDNFWWEVEQTEEDDAVYYCEKNDTYYTYDDTNNKWIVKTVKVTFTNYDGSTITYKNKAGNTVDAVFDIAFGSKPEYLIGYPKRDADNYYVYSFVGWLPEITNDTKVFENTTYVAQYERADKLYAITFKDGTKTLELDYYGWGSMPVCEKLPTKEGYILSWSPALGAVSGDQTYTAVWTAETVDPTTLSYTVTWKNYEGTTLETDTEVPYGVTPSYDGATPAKAAIKDIAFVHDGWTPDVTPVTGNVTYTAKFRETPALYTVTFLAQDGITVLDEQQVAYGEVPVCQNMPTQASTAEEYFVAKWDPQIAAVTGNITYTHDGFTAYKNTCRLTVAASANGSVLLDGASDPLSAIYDYGTEVTISATAAEHYHFAQWSDGNTSNPRTVTVTETKTLTAQFAIDQVTITWLNYDGATIATSEVDYGATPAFSGATPNRPTGCGVFYTFNGWSPAFVAATAATSYTAQYNEVANPSLKSYQVAFEENGGIGSMSNQSFTYGSAQTLKANTFAHDSYTITYVYANGDSNGSADATVSFNGWSDGENTYTDKQSVNNLTEECDGVVTLTAQWAVGSVTLPTPERAGYTFSGWYDGEVKIGDAGANYVPTSNKTLTANWTIKQYDITWKNADGTPLTTTKVNYNETPEYTGATPTKAATAQYTYTFNGWTPAIVVATENAIYTATFASTTNKYTITFANIDGNGGTSKVEYEYGATPSYAGTPAKAEDANYTYEFAGWDKAFATVTEATTYTANFNSTRKACQITFVNWDGDVLQQSDVNFGVIPTYNGETPVKEATAQFSYTFIGWDVTPVAVAGAATYTATFAAVLNKYTVIWTDEEDNVLGTDEVEYGVMPSHADLTKAETAEYTYEWNGWDQEIAAVTGAATYKSLGFTATPKSYTLTWDLNGGDITTPGTAAGSVVYNTALTAPIVEKTGYTFNGWNPEVPASMPAANATYVAQWIKNSEDMTVSDDQTIEENTVIPNLTITNTGSVTIDASAGVTVVNNLVLESTPDANLGAVLSGNIEVQGHAYIDITMNKSGKMDDKLYYSFAVPFNVNTNGGVYRKVGDDYVEAKTWGYPGITDYRKVDYIAYTYDEAVRATKGMTDDCWKVVNHGDVLVPGKFYMIQFANSTANVYRFEWNQDGELNNQKPIDVITTGNNALNSGWHGVANNGLGYNTLSGSFLIMQTLNSAESRFDSYTPTQALAMGKPAFVQMAKGRIIVGASAPASVARRVAANTAEQTLMEVEIRKEGAATVADKMFLTASEDALNEYEMGKDVAKMFMGTPKVAQMWVNAYGTELVANDAQLIDNQATYDLSIFAPATGNYVISLASEYSADEQLYLTENGLPIFNLSLYDYTMQLPAGTSNAYGLLLTRRVSNVTTSIEGATDSATISVEKVLKDGKMYIITGEHVFDAQGKMVK